MIKKLRTIFKYSLIVALPVSLYVMTYQANVDDYKVESVAQAVQPAIPVASAVAQAKTPVLAKADTKTTVKKPAAKKTTAKKKTTKKKAKKKERLIAVPALITPETAPHTGR